MAAPDKTASDLATVLYGRKTARPAMTGPQEAVIVSVTGVTVDGDGEPQGAGASCYFTVPAYSKTYKFGPAPCPPAAAAGMRALAVFVGSGTADGWIVAVTTVTKPAGF